MTIEERLTQVEGRPTGFDYMRIILAVGVVLWHSIATSYGNAAQDQVQASWWRPGVAFILPMFFCLSGFLVAGSLERSKTLVGFLGLRVIRIYPALAVEVLLSALILGPLLTTVPLASYFTDPRFYEYLVNVTGHIHYELPGVFLDNPNPNRVNGQLWTVPFELLCYVTICGMAAIGLAKRRGWFLVGIGVLWALTTAGFLWKHGVGAERAPSNVPGYTLIIFFLGGIATYLFRDKLRWSAPLALLAAAATIVLLEYPMPGDFLAPMPMAYLTTYLGLLNPRKIRLLQGADYSYGIFLYGYVIQQAWMTLGPAVQHWYINIALALPTVTLFAAASWHLIEKPALRMRAGVKAIEHRWMRHRHHFVEPFDRLLGRLLPPRRVQ